MQKRSILELGFALMTLKSKCKVCGMQEKSTMDLGWVTMTLKSKSKVWEMQEKEQNGAGIRNNDRKE